MGKITPCLWFDTEAEEAARFYTSLFPSSKILEISHYTENAPRPAGEVLTVRFALDGDEFVALNAGPDFPFTEAVSFQVPCADQAEVDRLWTALAEGGEEGQCGWVKDRYGLWWQVFPTRLPELLGDPDPQRSARAMQAMLGMRKIDLVALERAAEGAAV
jgi:predicted 3-demethylubiquinone-9 3-methyltransferase (glyoxalase superfamily)